MNELEWNLQANVRVNFQKKPNHNQTSQTKNNNKTPKMIESSLGGVGEATSSEVLSVRQNKTLQLTVRACFCMGNAAGATGGLVVSCLHSAELVFCI